MPNKRKAAAYIERTAMLMSGPKKVATPKEYLASSTVWVRGDSSETICIARVTEPYGKVLTMMLNPKSEYFREGAKEPNCYFRRIKHTDLEEIKKYISQSYAITKEENFLGIVGERVFDTIDERYASLYIIAGTKR